MTLKTPAILTLLALAMIHHSSYAEAEIYKWIDADGVVNYSAEPPTTGVNSLTVDIDPPPPEKEARRAEERLKALTSKYEMDMNKHQIMRESHALSAPNDAN